MSTSCFRWLHAELYVAYPAGYGPSCEDLLQKEAEQSHLIFFFGS